MPELLSALITLLVFATLLSGIVETALSAAWNRSYFTAGLPIFTRRVPAAPKRLDPPTIGDLESHFRYGLPPLVFGKLSSNEYGFREKILAVSMYTPIMHGLLIFDYDHREVVVKGFLNSSMIFFTLAWYAGVLPGIFVQPLIVLFAIGWALIMGSLYAIQFYRYRNVATWAGRDWSLATRGNEPWGHSSNA